MIAARLTVTAAEGLPDGATIAVEVEHDDGYESFASVHFGLRLFRCVANTATRIVGWEYRREDWISRAPDEQWARIRPEATGLPLPLIASMARAAHAGLVACGARSVS